MNYKVIIASGLFLAVTIFSCYALTKHPALYSQANYQATTSQQQPTAEFILYYGEACPHCRAVEDYLSDNNITQKLRLISKEVYNDQANANELTAVAKSCGLSTKDIGVPLLWDGHQCIIGDQPIIDFLNNKINQLP